MVFTTRVAAFCLNLTVMFIKHYHISRCLKDYREGFGVICPNQQLCGAVTWPKDETYAMDVKASMDEFIRVHLNGSWRRLLAKVEDEHQRTPTLRKLNTKQRKKRNQLRMKRSSKYESKFPTVYYKFAAHCVPYAPSATAQMPLQVTSSYGLYNNINYMNENLTEDQMRYLVGRKEPTN
jgi:hypothetical protein